MRKKNEMQNLSIGKKCLKLSSTGPRKAVVWGDRGGNIQKRLRYASNSIIASHGNLGGLASDYFS